jgi:serine/threonine protein kinase
VREIILSDLELGEKIAQGGFSVIHKGKLNGTPVAIKKIFDPRLTDELLQEIQNEIVMQSILRHPNIAILMGVIPKIPDIYIVFEHVSQGSLYDMLHIKKNTIDLSTKERIRIARDAATVFEYMHHLGIVHRDIKSHNVLIDSSFHVKVCDFGLAKFNVSILNFLFSIG